MQRPMSWPIRWSMAILVAARVDWDRTIANSANTCGVSASGR